MNPATACQERLTIESDVRDQRSENRHQGSDNSFPVGTWRLPRRRSSRASAWTTSHSAVRNGERATKQKGAEQFCNYRLPFSRIRARPPPLQLRRGKLGRAGSL